MRLYGNEVNTNKEGKELKKRFQRRLALLLTLCLLSGNIAFAEELPAQNIDPVVEESVQNEESQPPEKEMEVPEENEVEVPEVHAENASAEDEDKLEASKETVPTPVGGTGDTIYLDGQRGEDGNNGTSKAQAVRSFGRAKELAEADENITEIIVVGTTVIKDEITLKGTKASISRGNGFEDYLFKVPQGAEATLKDIVIDGKCTPNEQDWNENKSLIYVDENSTLNIEEGTVLKKNTLSLFQDGEPSGGAIFAQSATIKMRGGVVENNMANYGGGIFLSNSTMYFSGGVIKENTAWRRSELNNGKIEYYSAGGGICADQGSKIYLSGEAEIRNNHARENGGGISLGKQGERDNSVLYMTGGTIAENTAGASGGGLFIQCSAKATISAGAIKDNQMTGKGQTNMRFGGGGIYVNGYKGYHNGELHLKNAIITGNIAEGSKKHPGDPVPDAGSGGGYAACPITDTKIYVTDGVAIYQNKARNKGKDLYILAHENYAEHSGEPTYNLSLRMLGGALWNWKYEGDDPVYPNDLLPPQKYKGPLEIKKEYADLPLRTDFDENEWVNSLAKVWITGNTSATRGGGIGSNGDVIFGTEGKTVDIRVKKKWDDNNNAKKIRPDSITVELIATYEGQEHVVETRVLNAANEWKTEFKKLPTVNADKEISYSVREAEVKGYDYTVTGNAEQGFTITNTPEIERIDIPVEKIWEDQGHESKRPVEIVVTLYANGVKTEKTLVLNQENGWKGTFKGLPKQEESKTILYTVEEVKIAGYDSKVTGSAEKGFIITNTPETPPPTPREKTVEIPVEKIWKDERHEDKRPTEITVTLYADGVATEKTLILSAANEWKGVFRNLPEKKDGKVITYTVKEVEVTGYESVCTGNQHDGFILTNTYQPEKPPTPPTPPKPPIPAIPFVRIPRAGA